MEVLPLEILIYEIFPNLALDDLLCLAATCQFFKTLVTTYVIPNHWPLRANIRVWSSEFGALWFTMHLTNHPILSEIHVQFKKHSILFSLSNSQRQRISQLVLTAALEHLPKVQVCHTHITDTYKQLKRAGMHSYLKLCTSTNAPLLSAELTKLHNEVANHMKFI